MRTPSIVLTSLLLLGLAACGDDDGPRPSEAAPPLPQQASSAPASAPPTTTSAPTTAPSTTTSTSPSATAGATPSARPSFPPAVTDPVQGGRYSAVYLAVVKAGASDAPAKLAERQASAVGYDTGTGDIDCEQGARKALELDATADYMGTSIFFADKKAAKQFVDAYAPGVVGTADVKAFCLD